MALPPLPGGVLLPDLINFGVPYQLTNLWWTTVGYHMDTSKNRMQTIMPAPHDIALLRCMSEGLFTGMVWATPTTAAATKIVSAAKLQKFIELFPRFRASYIRTARSAC